MIEELSVHVDIKLKMASTREEIEWTLKAEVYLKKVTTTNWVSVVVLSNNKLVTTDMTDKTHLLSLCLPEDQPSFHPTVMQHLNIAGLAEVNYLAVNKNHDQLFILDQQTVKVFNEQYQLLLKFIPRPAQHARPSCLAVDSDDTIAVGYNDTERISLHNPDGSHIRTVRAPMMDYCLAICTFYENKHQLVYTNHYDQMLLSQSFDSKDIFKVRVGGHAGSGREMEKPGDICCDRNGSIHVAVWRISPGEGNSGYIHQYSPDGEYIGCIDHGRTMCPRHITITPQGDLVIVGQNSIGIYHKE